MIIIYCLSCDIKNNESTYILEIMTLQFNSNFNTNSWYNLSNKNKSNDLYSLTIGQNETNNEQGIYYICLIKLNFIIK